MSTESIKLASDSGSLADRKPGTLLNSLAVVMSDGLSAQQRVASINESIRKAKTAQMNARFLSYCQEKRIFLGNRFDLDFFIDLLPFEMLTKMVDKIYSVFAEAELTLNYDAQDFSIELMLRLNEYPENIYDIIRNIQDYGRSERSPFYSNPEIFLTTDLEPISQ